ncbi:MAG: YhfC family intramembrane metalloprotease [Oscillospiraceae bacterium]
MNNVIFSAGVIAGMLITGIFCIVMPIAALVIFKLKNKEISLFPALIGAAMFFGFAMILEQLLHSVMLPILSGNAIGYTVYGALAAGVFEETGRFVGFKFLLKKHTDPRASIMYGIGHGGFEAVALIGVSMLSYAIIGILSNSMGFEAMVSMLSAGNNETAEVVRNQLAGIAGGEMSSYLFGSLERVSAMIIHISLSVIVFEGVRIKGRIWLYTAAIVLHAITDVPAALYQSGCITSIAWTEILIFAWSFCVAFIAWQSYKRLKKQVNNT